MSVDKPALLKGPFWKKYWPLVLTVAAVALALGQIIDLPNKALDTYLKIKAVFFSETAREQRPHATALYGAVFDPDGDPLPGVRILLSEYGVRAESDSDGRFSTEMENPLSDVVSLRAEKQGFQSRNLDAPLGDSTFNFVMRPEGSE